MPALDLWAGVEQPFDCPLVQNHQTVQSMWMDWTLEGQHGRRFVLLRHTHRLQRKLYPTCTNRSGIARHRFGDG